MRLQHFVDLVRDICQASVRVHSSDLHCPYTSCHDISSEDDGTDQGYDDTRTEVSDGHFTSSTAILLLDAQTAPFSIVQLSLQLRLCQAGEDMGDILI